MYFTLTARQLIKRIFQKYLENLKTAYQRTNSVARKICFKIIWKNKHTNDFLQTIVKYIMYKYDIYLIILILELQIKFCTCWLNSVIVYYYIPTFEEYHHHNLYFGYKCFYFVLFVFIIVIIVYATNHIVRFNTALHKLTSGMESYYYYNIIIKLRH